MIDLPYKKTICLDFPDEIEIKLFQIFLTLNKEYGATYMSYTCDRSDQVRSSFRTDSYWSQLYQNETILGKPIIESCPLDIASREKKNMYLIWDLYSHKRQPHTYREIMGMREDAGLHHGLTLSTYFGAHHDAIAIATDDKSNDLVNTIFLKDYASQLQKSLIACRNETLTFFNLSNT